MIVLHTYRLVVVLSASQNCLHKHKNFLGLHTKKIRGKFCLSVKMASSKPLHDMLKPLSWMLGRWKSDAGFCHYPTIKDLTYGEDLHIEHIGQPNLSYTSFTWNADTKQAMHRETGFIRIQPDQPTHIALLLSHNNGVCEVSEGTVDPQAKQISLKSCSLGRLTFGKDPSVKLIERKFKLIDENTLEQIVYMESSRVPLTEHLKITYKKVST